MTGHGEATVLAAALAGGPVWRYLDGGAVRHRLVSDGARTAVCGHAPWAVWEWRGGAEAELAELARLRNCLSCVRMAGCRHVACVAARETRAQMPWSW